MTSGLERWQSSRNARALGASGPRVDSQLPTSRIANAEGRLAAPDISDCKRRGSTRRYRYPRGLLGYRGVHSGTILVDAPFVCLPAGSRRSTRDASARSHGPESHPYPRSLEFRFDPRRRTSRVSRIPIRPPSIETFDIDSYRSPPNRRDLESIDRGWSPPPSRRTRVFQRGVTPLARAFRSRLSCDRPGMSSTPFDILPPRRYRSRPRSTCTDTYDSPDDSEIDP